MTFIYNMCVYLYIYIYICIALEGRVSAVVLHDFDEGGNHSGVFAHSQERGHTQRFECGEVFWFYATHHLIDIKQHQQLKTSINQLLTSNQQISKQNNKTFSDKIESTKKIPKWTVNWKKTNKNNNNQSLKLMVTRKLTRKDETTIIHTN